jgi:hypothetical protein
MGHLYPILQQAAPTVPSNARHFSGVQLPFLPGSIPFDTFIKRKALLETGTGFSLNERYSPNFFLISKLTDKLIVHHLMLKIIIL